MDEIAVHVDAKGVERLMGVVESLVGNVESVFMISHNPVFDGYGDKNMVVTRRGGYSSISFD
jgi:DNA repair exonuclease SbcCD ATPase subunit